MAARRLVMVLLVLLIVSTFAATLVPPPTDDPNETSTTTTTRSTTTAEVRARTIQATVSAQARKPELVRVTLGDELELRVTSDTFHEVEIPTLGEFDEVDEFAPAVFDLVPDQAGTYPVRLIEGDRVIARIVVSESGRRA
jgi:plastocyanin